MKYPNRLLASTLMGLALTAFQSVAQLTVEPYTFTTFAGSAEPPGSTNGTGGEARFNVPSGVAVDSAGNVYVADSENHTIRKVTPSGVVTTLAGLARSPGSTDGTGTAARFFNPSDVAVDGAGIVYVADAKNHTIRKVTSAGEVTTLAGQAGSSGSGSADGTGSDARFSTMSGLALDGAGNLYVADTYNHTIRKVTPAGEVTTIAGLAGQTIPYGADGAGNAARFNFPRSLAVDSAGNVYVADTDNHTIRRVTPAGEVTTLAGRARISGSADGTGIAARFFVPSGIALDSAGNIYVADFLNFKIRKVTPSGTVTTLAGGGYGSTEVTGVAPWFGGPSGVTVDSEGIVYVADSGNNTIRKINSEGTVTTLAGRGGGNGSADGFGVEARFWAPSGVATDSNGNVYVADANNHTIRKVTSTGVVTTLAGRAGNFGSADGTGSAARFQGPTGVAADSAGNIYVADYLNSTIRKVTPGGAVTTLAGLAERFDSVDGTGSAARFKNPSGVAVDTAGNVYVADLANFTIRKVTPARVVTTLAGSAGDEGSVDGTGSAARFAYPSGVAVDNAGNVYVADGDTIRKVMPAGEVTTLAGRAGISGSADGTGSAARFSGAAGVAVDDGGDVLVADRVNHTIRKVTSAGVVTTLAGRARLFGISDGTGTAARFEYPNSVAVDRAGNVFVADTDNNTIRRGYPPTTIQSSGPAFGFNDSQFGFNLTGPGGRMVAVDSSTDLVNWLPLWSNTFSGALNFIDPQSASPSNRFFRARLP